MTTAILNREVTHPIRWIFVSLVATVALSLLWCLQHRPPLPWGPATTPLDQVLWTSDPAYQTFYGPGTPQSLAVIKRINTLQQKGDLAKDFLLVPNVPVYIAPFTSDFSYRADDPEMIVNFQAPMAKLLREGHQPK